MEERRIREWEGKPLKVVVEELKKGWTWYSPAIPRAWGRALEQIFKDQLDEVKVERAVYKRGMFGSGADSRYWFDVIIKLDRNVEKVGGKIVTKGDVLFGSVPKGVRIENDTVVLTAMY